MNFPLKDGTEWTLPKEMYEYFDREYPLIDIDVELNKMRRWLECDPPRRKTSRGMKRAINYWLGNDSIPKAVRKQKTVDNRHAQWHSQCGFWLNKATKEDITAHGEFRQRLKELSFRAWAESINPIVKEIA